MKTDFFLDSGAYSALTQGSEINLDEYITFIQENEDVIDIYANLDVIGDAKGTLKNQKKMERAGLSPLPVFHYGEPIEYLEKYLKKYDFIGLGGMVPISTPDLSVWLDALFSDCLTGDDGMPLVKIHGFGLTSVSLMLRYPWYSVDSSSWVIKGRMGGIFVPERRGKSWTYTNHWSVLVSSRTPSDRRRGVFRHIDHLSPSVRKIVDAYVEEAGFVLGESTFREEPAEYELQDDEKWVTLSGVAPAKGTSGTVETIVVPGIANDFKQRDLINMTFFLGLEKEIPKFPWAYTPRERGGFDL